MKDSHDGGPGESRIHKAYRPGSIWKTITTRDTLHMLKKRIIYNNGMRHFFPFLDRSLMIG